MIFLINKDFQSTSNYLQLCVSTISRQFFHYIQCLEENWRTILWILALYLIFSVFLYIIFVQMHNSWHVRSHLTENERILIVISHPDDECMFFGPTIVNLTRCKDQKIFLLCLSYGNYYDKGKLRKDELWKSCSMLGIPESNIFLQKISSLPDNPKVAWDENVIHNVIINYVETFHFDAIITFDKDGVSGHSNHKAVYYALAHAVGNRLLPSYCSVYCLDSVNILRKYSSVFDFSLSVLFSSNWFILSLPECYLIKKAMTAHRTQYIWYRKLYIWISRYAYINTLSMLHANEALFDINYRDVYT